MQLWDVCTDQEAVDLVKNIDDPQEASKMLVDYALQKFSSDNLSCMIVRLDNVKTKAAAAEAANPAVEAEASGLTEESLEEKKVEPVKNNE